MTKPHDGGPAFPRQDERGPHGEGIREGWDGMSLRDWFAGRALTGLLAQTPKADSAALFAREAYVAADAMLAARESKS